MSGLQPAPAGPLQAQAQGPAQAPARVRAIIFDFDGVVLDSEEPDFLAWREIWRELGQELVLEEWAACIGTGQGEHTFDPFAELVRRARLPTSETTEPELKARHAARMAELMSGRPPLAGVVAWLQEATVAGLGIGIASSSRRDWIEAHLARLGLEKYVSVISSFDDCGARKPDPASYRLACRELGASPGEALAVEDSHNGLLAAKAAGLRCVVVPNVMTAQMDFSAADVVLASLDQAGPLEVMERLA